MNFVECRFVKTSWSQTMRYFIFQYFILSLSILFDLPTVYQHVKISKIVEFNCQNAIKIRLNFHF